MKALLFLIPLFVVNACKTQTGTVISSDNTNMGQIENKEEQATFFHQEVIILKLFSLKYQLL